MPDREEEMLLDVVDTKKEFARVWEHYGITETMVNDSMQSIKDWYKMQPHLPPNGIDNERLLRMLQANGYSIEKTKKKLDNFMASKNLVPELVCNRDPWSVDMKRALLLYDFVVWPKRTDNNERVLLFRNNTKDLKYYSLWDMYKIGFMTLDYRSFYDTTVGDHYIYDFVNDTPSHLPKGTPTFFKKALFILTECFSSKIKGIHVLNLQPHAEIIITIVKMILPNKIKDRIHIHSNYESLQDFFPKRIIPRDYGGDEVETKVIADRWREKFSSEKWRQWFVEQDEIKSDESKRVGTKSDISGELLGIQGSFRKLDLD